MTDDTLKARILRRLTSLNISPRRASLNAGLSDHFLQRVLRAENPSISTINLLRLADSLETSPEWLLTGRKFDDGPPETAELVAIYMDMDESERAALVEYAKWRLQNKK